MRRVGRWVKRNLLGIPAQVASPFRLNREEAEARRSGGAIEEIFFSGKCRLVHKWVDYLPIYERLFAPYRKTNVTMIEIGVSEGGSLDMWREYTLTPRGSEKVMDFQLRIDSLRLHDRLWISERQGTRGPEGGDRASQ